jgi:small-conductance mechanosensitive channel
MIHKARPKEALPLTPVPSLPTFPPCLGYSHLAFFLTQQGTVTVAVNTQMNVYTLMKPIFLGSHGTYTLPVYL